MNYRPKRVVWELTNACNAKCIHCGSQSGSQRECELTEEEALRVCDELAELGAEHVTMMGGEFFLCHYWEKVAKRLLDHGIKVGPLTNGFLLNDKNIQKIKDLGIPAVFISIDGLRDTHDYVRGVPGLFDKLVENLKKAQAAGLRVGVNTAISALNIEQLDDIYQLLLDLGVSTWQLQLVENVGNAFENEKLRMTMDQIYNMAKKITRYRRKKVIRVEAADNIGYFCQFEPLLRDRPFTGCGGGRTLIGIHANGDVRGCLSIMCTNDSLEGNVRERSLKDLWFDPERFTIYRNRQVEDLTGFCRECEYNNICRGGCTAMAYSLTGTYKDNPFCLHRYEVEKHAEELTEADFD